LRRARQFNVPGVVVEKSVDRDLTMLTVLQSFGVGLVVLAGYMQKVGPLTLKAYQGRIINMHPSLLPKYGGKGMYGNRVHQAVLDSGDRETGVTIHHVTDEYDSGDIIAQCVVSVMSADTVTLIAERVKTVERRLICEVIQNWNYAEFD
jgi:phosphoribosylglycinamide formyltransferase-1